VKQCILVRKDLKMEKGKLSIQCAHASVESVLKSDKNIVEEWHNEGMKKIALKVEDKRELIKFKKMAEDVGLVTALITDAGLTVFKKPTVTCMAVGPDDDEKVDKITKGLKLL